VYHAPMNPWRSANRRNRLRQTILAWLFPLAGTLFLLIAVIVAIVQARG